MSLSRRRVVFLMLFNVDDYNIINIIYETWDGPNVPTSSDSDNFDSALISGNAVCDVVFFSLLLLASQYDLSLIGTSAN